MSRAAPTVALFVAAAAGGFRRGRSRQEAEVDRHDQGSRESRSRRWCAIRPPTCKQQQAIEQYRRFSSCNLTTRRCAPRRRVASGDLQVEVDESARAGGEASLSGVELGEAIKLYEGLLAAQPDYERNDAVMYQLARAYEAQAQPEKALAVLDQLVDEASATVKWATEAQFRRGEILFSAGRYREAETCLRRRHPRGRRQRLLRAGSVQTRLVAVQAESRRGERRVIPASARSHARRRRQAARARLARLVRSAS